MNKRTKVIVYIIICSLLLTTGAIWARRVRRARLTASQPEVTLARIVAGDVKQALSLTGKAEPIQRATLKSPVAGKLISIIGEGSVVAQDAVLAEIEFGPKVTAPFPGLVVNSALVAGEFVTAGQNLLVMANNNTIVIRTTIDELDYHRVFINQPVRVTFEAVPGKEFVGRVARKALEARAQGDVSVFDIWIEVDNPTDVMLGMTADCEIVFAEARGTLRAPNEAVFYEEGIAYVYTVNSEMIATKRAVEVGIKDLSFTEVKGVAQDSRVVTSNIEQVVDGAKVRLRQAQRNNPGLFFRR